MIFLSLQFQTPGCFGPSICTLTSSQLCRGFSREDATRWPLQYFYLLISLPPDSADVPKHTSFIAPNDYFSIQNTLAAGREVVTWYRWHFAATGHVSWPWSSLASGLASILHPCSVTRTPSTEELDHSCMSVCPVGSISAPLNCHTYRWVKTFPKWQWQSSRKTPS